jgi:hypothetical protein
MTARQLEKLLLKLPGGEKACSDAREWSKGKTLKKAWKECVRADWMCWLLVKMSGEKGWPNKSVVRQVLCDCAETALKYTKDPRPAKTIRIARLYADGKATEEQLAAAWDAAWDAAGAAAGAAAWSAAWAAAGAAAGDAAWDAAGDAAGDAAWDAAWAAAGVAAGDAAWAAAWVAAWDAALKKMSYLIRKRIPKI